VAEIPAGYKDIPEADQKKAQNFFEHGRKIADTGNYEYAIEMYFQGLGFDPEALDAHKAVRELALIRKAGGGKPLGMFERAKLKKGDEKQNMLNAEKLLAYDPGNSEYMDALMSAALKAGCYDTVLWIGMILLLVNVNAKTPSFGRYIKIKEAFKSIGRYREAIDAMNLACQMKRGDMELAHELKDLAARLTMKEGNYESGDSFRGSIRDMDAQKKLMAMDTDVRTEEGLNQAVVEAREVYERDKTDVANFNKYMDALRKTEEPKYEAMALEMLEAKYQETRQYRFRQAKNQITLTQLSRGERSFREKAAAAPNDPEVRKSQQNFLRSKAEQELLIFKETVENYPTDSTAKFEMGKRMFMLGRYEESIGVFQQVRSDPKYKVTAMSLLGRAFLQAGFTDEAVDTLHEAIRGYQGRDDERAIEIHYYCATALEAKGDIPAAIKMYSQVAQWNFTYRDVQQRIKRLRAGGQPPQSSPAPHPQPQPTL
jgi:tetratricopeptide (TPR) repeat protein